MTKILILANHYNTLRIFRRELICALSKNNEVFIVIPPCDDENKKILESYGADVKFLKMERRGMNPIKDLTLLLHYNSIIKKIHPDKVITYTIKCNIYGAMICKWKKIPCYVNVTGLGSTYQKNGLTRKFVSMLYKVSLSKTKYIFFENSGNRDTLVNEGIVKVGQTVVMPGAGVNLSEFSACQYPLPNAPIRFLFVGRIMKEKGVDELFYAIKKIKQKFKMVSFDFIGWYEDNYKTIVEELQNEGYVRFYGFQSDVRPFIRKAHCIVLPSYHEGMSNTLLEGAAMCRPLITSNIHGCMEAVQNGRTGYLVEVGNAEDLYEKMLKFINLRYEEKIKMGINGRNYMKEMFDKETVVNRTMQILFSS